jgi:hypothetical protein
MAFEHKENTATVFNNDKKSADNQPDYTGKGKVQEATGEISEYRTIQASFLSFSLNHTKAGVKSPLSICP